jgi:hypothetical protein
MLFYRKMCKFNIRFYTANFLKNYKAKIENLKTYNICKHHTFIQERIL